MNQMCDAYQHSFTAWSQLIRGYNIPLSALEA